MMRMMTSKYDEKGNRLCPNCDSTQIAKFRLDSDWATGAGDFWPINNDSEYTKEQLEDFDKSHRPDVEVLICLNCTTYFD